MLRAAVIAPTRRTTRPAHTPRSELHATDGGLEGLKLIAIWERRTGGGRNVTFTARQYAIHGERRRFALLRCIADIESAQQRIRELVLYASAECEETVAAVEQEAVAVSRVPLNATRDVIVPRIAQAPEMSHGASRTRDSTAGHRRQR
jgi:hypothetical protein